MKTLRVACALIGLLLAGCIVTSLHPLFTDGERVAVADLPGAWANEEGEIQWIFRAAEDNTYTLIFLEENDKPQRFAAAAGQIGGRLFLDLKPHESDVPSSQLRIPVHLILRMDIKKDALTLSLLSMDWLKEQTEQGKVKIAWTTVDGVAVITASTAELKAFIQEHANDPAAFGDPQTCRRLKTGPAPQGE